MRRSSLRLLLLAALAAPLAGHARDEAQAAWAALRQPGAIVLFRHATAPGVGDPERFRLGDCSTQRNLDERGRAESRQLGQAFRQRNIEVGAVLSSQWCRTMETARLAFADLAAGGVREAPAFNSFFGEPGRADPQTETAREMLRQWKGPGALVVVTHQVNIRALTGELTRSGEGLVVRVPAGEGPIEVIGRLQP
ncbi:histidine phosphatase family protein [Ramlibacter rhizophilus]|uniref:Histidine phosphatase family protein n=1 Tax=Ramlibacter rhizophilus TaxID=1781167 RepID=A0A4Z0BF97_9BURK|nr:histidine phosphatase family protein [Ramlibacter rhizophilus]TFY96987.1 histidine phosphatase family protein [Ramlibacter rhizophilus]